MTHPGKKILFISRHAPYGSSLAKEALDALLATSAYNQELGLLFIDDGVFQLLRNQESSTIGQKNFSAMLPALSLYDINNIYIHKESLEIRGISAEELIINSAIVDSNAVKDLMNRQDQLLSF